MNATDARVIGASAVTAAAVAMVTVVVYEGHVKVGQPGGQTVIVAPGTTYEVKPEPPVVGAAPVEQTVGVDDDIPDELDRASIHGVMRQLGPGVDACAKAPTDGTKVTMRVTVAPDGSVAGGLVEELFTPWPASPGPALTRCIADVLMKARFAVTKRGASFSYPFVFHAGHVIQDP
jgi:hypothetical protein